MPEYNSFYSEPWNGLLNPAPIPPAARFGSMDPMLGTMSSGGMGPAYEMTGGGNMMMMMLSQMLGKAMGAQVDPFMAGRTHSPMAFAQMQADMEVRGALGARGREIDEAMMRAQSEQMLRALHNRDATQAELNEAMADARKTAAMVSGITNNPLYPVFAGMTGLDKVFEGAFGTPASSMAGPLYFGTRHMGWSQEDMSRTMGQIQGRAYTPEGAYNSSFAQGFNRREISEVTAGLAQRGVLSAPISDADPRSMNKVEGALRLTAGLKDIFGQDKSIQELFSNLQQMTGGALEQMDPATISTMVERIKTVAQRANVSLQAMTLLAQQGSQYARQLGFAGPMGAEIATSAVGDTNAIMRVREQGGGNAYWGQWTEAQVANEVMQNKFRGASSLEGVHAAGVLRLASERPDAGLGGLAERIRAGTLTEQERIMLGSGMNTGSEIARLSGGRITSSTAQIALEDRLANSQYISQADAGIGQGQDEIAKLHFGAVLARSGELRRLGLADDAHRTAIVNAMFSGANDEDRQARLKQIMGGRGGPDAAANLWSDIVSGGNEMFGNVREYWELHGDRQSAARKAQSALDAKRTSLAEAMQKAFGGGGTMGTRLANIVLSPGKMGWGEGLLYTLGMSAPDEQSARSRMAEIIKMSGGDPASIGEMEKLYNDIQGLSQGSLGASDKASLVTKVTRLNETLGQNAGRGKVDNASQMLRKSESHLLWAIDHVNDAGQKGVIKSEIDNILNLVDPSTPAGKKYLEGMKNRPGNLEDMIKKLKNAQYLLKDDSTDPSKIPGLNEAVQGMKSWVGGTNAPFAPMVPDAQGHMVPAESVSAQNALAGQEVDKHTTNAKEAVIYSPVVYVNGNVVGGGSESPPVQPQQTARPPGGNKDKEGNYIPVPGTNRTPNTP